MKPLKPLEAFYYGIFFFVLACVLANAFAVFSQSEKEAIIYGAFVQAFGTIIGAFFVIIAAKIQAKGTEDQITYERKKDAKNHMRKYVGWLTVMLNTYSVMREQNRGRWAILASWKQDTHLDKVQNIEQFIKAITPERPVANDAHIDLLSILPKQVMLKIQEGNQIVGRIQQLAINIQNRLLIVRAGSDNDGSVRESIQDQVKQLYDGYEVLIKVYDEGLPIGQQHLQNMMSRISDQIIDF